MTRRSLDVGHLPTMAFGHRDPLWWGVMGLIAIESTMFALLIATYFYVRGNHAEWPPADLPGAVQGAGLAGVGLLLASAATMHQTNKAALEGKLRPIRRWLIITTVLGLGFLVLRFLEFKGLHFRWNTHAYGSVFWTALGLHTLHGVASCLENLVLLALLFKGPVEKKHLVDTHTNGIYWYFVVFGWVPVAAILYLEPLLARS
jgi:cytochrome c oxidase subunit III